jgi:two-component system OmpR family sensor kinase
MKNFSFGISSQIIHAHMSNQKLNFSNFKNAKYKFALLDRDKNIIFGEKIDKKKLFIEDKSPLGHLGVWSIIVQNDSFETQKGSLKQKLILGFVISYFIIAIVGFYLIKLFLKPIKESRIKLDNFIKDTTHELNTPITAIMMCANKEKLSNPKNIDRIYLSAKRLSELYKDLTYLFLEDKEDIKESIVLKDIILEQLSYFEVLAKTKNISIKVDLDDTKLLFNSEDFKRILSNLLSNAIKYNRQNGTIKITLKNYILNIEDSGIGIQKEYKDKIFNRYFRATTQGGGFGVGLNIVKKICQENSIEITISSDKNGSKFILDLSKLST